MTNFPLITLANLPTDFDVLVNAERKDYETNCYDAHPVSFWEYAKALLELEKAGIIGSGANGKEGWALNKSLAFLFFHSEPVTADDVAADLGYAHYGGANLRLGEFGAELRKILGHTSTPPYDKNVPYDIHLCSFIAFVTKNDIGILFLLRHQFRAALAQCFGETELRRWLNATKPN